MPERMQRALRLSERVGGAPKGIGYRHRPNPLARWCRKDKIMIPIRLARSLAIKGTNVVGEFESLYRQGGQRDLSDMLGLGWLAIYGAFRFSERFRNDGDTTGNVDVFTAQSQ